MESQLIAREELLIKAKIKRPTLAVYIKKGLVDRPTVVSNYNGKRGRIGLYYKWSIERIENIKKLVKEGYTLDQIKEKFSSQVNVIDLDEIQRKLLKSIQEKLIQNSLTRDEIDNITQKINLGWTQHTLSEAQMISKLFSDQKDKNKKG